MSVLEWTTQDFGNKDLSPVNDNIHAPALISTTAARGGFGTPCCGEITEDQAPKVNRLPGYRLCHLQRCAMCQKVRMIILCSSPRRGE